MYIYYFNAIAQKQIIDNSFFFANKKSILPIYGIYFYIKNFKIINEKLKQKILIEIIIYFRIVFNITVEA